VVHVCVFFWQNFLWTPVSIWYARVGCGGLSPDSVNCSENDAVHDRDSKRQRGASQPTPKSAWPLHPLNNYYLLLWVNFIYFSKCAQTIIFFNHTMIIIVICYWLKTKVMKCIESYKTHKLQNNNNSWVINISLSRNQIQNDY